MMARLRLIVWMAAAGGAAGASALELRSSRPENNVFVPGERIEFAVTGGEEAGRSLAVRVTDFWEQEVQAGERPLAGGSYTQAWTFDSPRLGYFLLSAEVRSGTASVARARMPFAVIPPPTAEMAAPEFRRSPFGLCGAGIGPSALTGPLKEFRKFIGGRWHFTGAMAWRGVEKQPGVWNFGEVASQIRDDYVRVMPYITQTPEWAQKAPKSYYPRDWTGVTEYATRAASFYREHVKPPRVYLLGNEWCGIEATKGDIQDEITYNRLAAQAIRAADPEATILLYGPEGDIHSGRSRKLYESGVFDLCDGFHIHYYINSAVPETGSPVYGERVDAIRAVLAQYGYTNKQAWLVEQGNSTQRGTGINETQKANAIVRRTVMALARNIECYIEFSPADYPPNSHYGLVHDQDFFLGRAAEPKWAPRAIFPKESFPAYCIMVRQLTGAEYVQRLDYLGATAMGTVFRKEGKPVLVLWDYSGEPQKVELEVGAPEVRVTDLMGNERPAAAGADGILALTLTESPVYVHGASADLFLGAKQEVVALAEPLLPVFPGERTVIRGTLANPFARVLEGTLTLTLPAEIEGAGRPAAVRLEPGAQHPFEFEVKAAATAPCRLYPAVVRVDEGGKAAGRGLARVDVRPPLVIAKVLPSSDIAGKRALRVTLENRKPVEMHGVMTALFKGEEAGKIDYRLAPGQTADLACAIQDNAAPDPAVKWPFELVCRDADTGVAVESRAWLSFTPGRRAARAPVVDGDLGDWEGPPAAVLDDAAQVRPRDDWKGPDDLSGAVRLAWDGECLYVGVEVKDQHFRQEHTGVMTWAGDSIQVAADPLPGERQEYHQMSMDYTKKFSEYILALTTNGPSVYRSGSWDRRRPVGPVGPQDVRLAVRRTDNGLVYEAAFSWESLSMERPDPGRAIGLALTLNDRDEADGPFQGMEWFGGILYAKDPDKFGQVVLQP